MLNTKIHTFIAAILLLVVAVTVIAVKISTPDEQVLVTEVSLSNVTADLSPTITKAIPQAGMHLFHSEDGTYVLLTYGDATGYDMKVSSHISENDVYFRLYSEKAPDGGPVYKLFKVQNTVAISANTASLLNPEYLPGVEGINIGWIYAADNSISKIVPLLDPDSNDDSFSVAGDAYIDRDGLYRYTYAVTSTGTNILSAVRLDSHDCQMTLQWSNDGQSEVIDTSSGLTMHFAEKLRSQLAYAIENRLPIKLTISCPSSGPYIADINSGSFLATTLNEQEDQ